MGESLEIVVFKNIKINYRNRGLAHMSTSILQKEASLNKKSAARVDIFREMTGTAGFLISPIFRPYLDNTVYMCIHIYIYML